jgi:DNA-binding response OmpR family regulator
MLLPSQSEQCRRVVAVVDDDSTVRETIQAILEYDGYEVRLFRGAADSHDGIASARPDLVIVDLMLNGRLADVLLETLRSQPETASIPVMVCTAASLAPTFIDGLQRHGYRLVRKPFDMDVFLETVRVLVRR